MTAENKIKSTRAINKLAIFVNESCNLRCRYCYVRLSPKKFDNIFMSTVNARKILRNTLNGYSHCEFIQFFGGEPTLNLDAIEAIIDEINIMVDEGRLACKPRISIVTNGVPPNVDRTIRFIDKYRIETTISIDGPAFIHDELRIDSLGKPTHEKVLEMIYSLKNTNVPLALEAVYTSLHMNKGYSLIDLFEYCSDIGVKKLIFEKTYPPAPDNLNPLLDPYFGKLIEYYEAAVDWWFQSLFKNDDLLLDVYFKDLLLPILNGIPAAVSSDGCLAGQNDFAIGPNGDKYVCQLLYGYSDYKMGNVLNSAADEKRPSFPRGTDDIASCGKCFARYWCQPCAALNLFWGNQWEPPVRECALRQAVILRLGFLAFQYLDVPVNEITRILQEKVNMCARP